MTYIYIQPNESCPPQTSYWHHFGLNVVNVVLLRLPECRIYIWAWRKIYIITVHLQLHVHTIVVLSAVITLYQPFSMTSSDPKVAGNYQISTGILKAESDFCASTTLSARCPAPTSVYSTWWVERVGTVYRHTNQGIDQLQPMENAINTAKHY